MAPLKNVFKPPSLPLSPYVTQRGWESLEQVGSMCVRVNSARAQPVLCNERAPAGRRLDHRAFRLGNIMALLSTSNKDFQIQSNIRFK